MPEGRTPRTVPRPAVEGAIVGGFLKGDSGRGRDGLDLGFSEGEGALALGPIV